MPNENMGMQIGIDVSAGIKQAESQIDAFLQKYNGKKININVGDAFTQASNNAKTFANNTDISTKKLQTMNNQLQQLQNTMAKIGSSSDNSTIFKKNPNLLNQYDELNAKLKTADVTSEKWANGNYSQQVKNLQSDLKVASNNMDGLTTKILSNAKAFLQWYIIGNQVSNVFQAIKNGITTVEDLNKTLVNLQMATGYDKNQTSDLIKSYSTLGQSIGATTNEVAESADEWLRQGKSVSDTSTLIQDSMILSKVGMIDSASATTYLTSAMKGYNVETSKVLGIVDKLSSVDLVSATSASGLAEAMSKTANAANLAGVSMDKLLGYLAVVGETTQKSMSEVGTSFQAIFSRMGNVAAKKNVDESGESLNNVETVLNRLKINLRDSQSQFRNFGDVLDEVAGRWKSFTNVEQNQIATAIAGTRQRENFLVLMQGYNTALKYSTTAMESNGTALQKMQNYTDSIEASTKKFKATLESLWNNAIKSDTIKNVIDFGTKAVTILGQLINSNDQLVPKVLAVVSAFALLIKGISNLEKASLAFNALFSSPLFWVAAVTTAISLVVKAYNDAHETTEQGLQKTKDLDSQIKAITDDQTDEYNTLLSKVGNLTDAEKVRLGILEQELETLKQQKATQANKTAKDYFNGQGYANSTGGYGTKFEANQQDISMYQSLDKSSSTYNEAKKKWVDEFAKQVELIQQIKDAGGDLTAAQESQFQTLSSIVGQYYTEVDQYYSKIKTSLSNISTAISDFNKNGKLSGDTIANIQKDFGDVDGIENYISTLKKSNITSEEVQKTLGNLTQAKLNDILSTGDLTSVTADSITKILQEIGVTNAAEVANNALAKAKEGTAVASLNSADAINTFINNLGVEAAQAGITKDSLANLVAEQIIFNETGLNTWGKVQQLKQLALAANITSAAIAGATQTQVSGWQHHAANQGLTTDENSGNYVLSGLWNSAVGSTEAQFGSIGNVSSGAGGGYASEATGKKKKGSGGGSNSSEEVEKQEDKFWKLEDDVTRAKDRATLAGKQGNAVDIKTIETLKEKNQLLNDQNTAYSDEQVALHTVAEAKREQIAIDQESLAAMGVTSDYNASLNELEVNQDELNSLSGKSYTAAYKLAKEMESLNKDNQESSSTWNELSVSIKENTDALKNNLKKYLDVVTAYNEHQINLLTNQEGNTKSNSAQIIALYKQMQEQIHNTADQYRAMGVSETDSLITDLSDKWWSYQKNIDSVMKDTASSYSDSLNTIVSMTEDMIKKEVETQIDDYKKLADLKKKSLDITEQENNYQDSLKDKVKDIAKIQTKLDALSLDNSREAKAQKTKLLEELADKQKDITTTQAENAKTVQEQSLDDMETAYEKAKNLEISSTEKLYQLAMNRISTAGSNLFSQLTTYNEKYGSSLSSTLTTAWNNALEAAQKYGSFVNALNVTSALSSDKNNSTTGGNANINSTTTAQIKSIVSSMKQNSANWASASDSNKKVLESTNNEDAKAISNLTGQSVYKDANGIWWIGSNQLYSVYHQGGAVTTDGTTTLKQDEMKAILKNKEFVLTDENQETIIEQKAFLDLLAANPLLNSNLNLSSLLGGLSSYPSSNSMQNISNARTSSVTFGNTYIYGADDSTIAKHQEITRNQMNEVLKVFNIKK